MDWGVTEDELSDFWPSSWEADDDDDEDEDSDFDKSAVSKMIN